jgi:type 1 glutamine amidotransferase
MLRAAAVLALVTACAESRHDPGPDAATALLFTRTTGFRHASIPAGIAAVQSLGTARGFSVEATEDAAAFSDDNLARFRVVVFLNTTGDVLNGAQQLALERFLRAGGGFVGVHSATDTEYDWAWYGGLVGAYFDSHPAIQQATVRLGDASHPSTAGLPAELARTDEWYNFRDDPSSRVNVLLTLDEASYAGGTMGPAHPVSWYHFYDGGRAWYSAMGHTEGSYTEPAFLAHLAGGILWAAGN